MEELGIVFPQPSIHLLGLRVDEPMTVLTDFFVTAACFIAYFRLRAMKLPGNSMMFFRSYFLLMGCATMLGGLFGHAFLYAFSFAWKLPGWITSMFSVAAIERSAIEHAKPLIDRRVGKFFLALNILELLTIMTITISSMNFRWVEFHSGYGLLAIVTPFHLYVYYKTRDKGSLTVVAAVGIASLAALTFMNRIAIHTWFNHLDISHVLMTIAAVVFYLGAKNMRRHEREDPAAV
jgi:hypothetical protein